MVQLVFFKILKMLFILSTPSVFILKWLIQQKHMWFIYQEFYNIMKTRQRERNTEKGSVMMMFPVWGDEDRNQKLLKFHVFNL